MCNAHDRQQILQEIHDPDFRLKKCVKGPVPSSLKFIIYELDRTKKCSVGPTTTKVLDLALEEIFYRMVMASEGMGPQYVGRIEPQHKFPDLTHPSQLEGQEFLNFMAEGRSRPA